MLDSMIDSSVNDKSFTIDIWTCDVSSVSMTSLIAQWLNTDFTLFRVVLHFQELNQFTFAHESLLFSGLSSDISLIFSAHLSEKNQKVYFYRESLYGSHKPSKMPRKWSSCRPEHQTRPENYDSNSKDGVDP